MDEATYDRLKQAIHALLGLDLERYKPQQMQRRLGNFIQQRAGGDLDAFLALVGDDAQALGELRDMITINVSEFFRDVQQFAILEQRVLPEIIQRRRRPSIWSAACSAGQEPYTIAMLLDELGAGDRSRIVATDFDETILRRARAGGPYVPEDLRQMSAERRERYMRADEGTGLYHIAPELRRMVSFRGHNLLEDDYGRGYDLIVCRNVIIYFSGEAKSEVIRRFHAALAPGGVLFIGGTEALLGSDSDGFDQIDGNFYRRIDTPAARAA